MFANFLAIAGVTSGVVLVVLAGLFSVRWGYFPKEGVPYMGRFMTHIALPCALFIMIAGQDFGDIFKPGFFFAYSLGTIATVAILVAWYVLTKRSLTDIGMGVVGAGVNNCLMVGLPIAAVLLDSKAMLIMAVIRNRVG